MCDNSKNTRTITENFHTDVDLTILTVCAIFLGKVTRNKKYKGKRKPHIYKHNFIQVLSFTFRFRSTLLLIMRIK